MVRACRLRKIVVAFFGDPGTTTISRQEPDIPVASDPP